MPIKQVPIKESASFKRRRNIDRFQPSPNPRLKMEAKTARIKDSSIDTRQGTWDIDFKIELDSQDGSKPQVLELVWPYKAFRNNLDDDQIYLQIAKEVPAQMDPDLQFQVDLMKDHRRMAVQRMSINKSSITHDNHLKTIESRERANEFFHKRKHGYTERRAVSLKSLPDAAQKAILEWTKGKNPTGSYQKAAETAKPEIKQIRKVLES